MIHDGVGHLDAHADVHLVVLGFQTQLVDRFAQPLCAAAPRRGHHIGRHSHKRLAAARLKTHARHLAVLTKDILGAGQFHKGGLGFADQVVVHSAQHRPSVFRAQVPHGARHQADVIAAGFVSDLVHAGVVEAVYGLAGAEAQVLLVRLADIVHGAIMADIVVDVAAHLVAQRQLAVRERARAGPAVDDGAGVAMQALPVFARRAGAVSNGTACVHDEHPALRTLLRHAQRGENTGRPRADNDKIVVLRLHAYAFLPQSAKPILRFTLERVRLAICEARLAFSSKTPCKYALSAIRRLCSACSGARVSMTHSAARSLSLP